MFDNMSASLKYVESGRLKALAVSAPARVSHLPNVPTINETGLTKFDGEIWMGVFAPANTPAPVVDSLRAMLVNVIRDPNTSRALNARAGVSCPFPRSNSSRFCSTRLSAGAG